MSTRHKIDWEKPTCFDYHERMFLESWYTESDSNCIYSRQNMPGAYYSSIVDKRARADFEHTGGKTRTLSADGSQQR